MSTSKTSTKALTSAATVAEATVLFHAAKLEDGALPTELMIQIVEQLVSQGGAQLQRDLCVLRRSSKLLNEIATPYFYRTIELWRGEGAMGLVKQLRRRSKLCETTKSIWWDEKKPMWPDHLSEPYVQFANVDEVGYWYTEETSEDPAPLHLGVHFAIRDIGAWCQPSATDVPNFEPLSRPLTNLQCTPTLNVTYSMLTNMLSQQPKRRIWAAHIVMPALMSTGLYVEPLTITHLTLTIASHPEVLDDDYEAIFEILDRETMPLLEYLTIRMVDFAKRADEPASVQQKLRQKLCAWDQRVAKIQMMLESRNDSRTRFELLSTPDLRRTTTLEQDVRLYTRNEWRERVYHGKPGPWRDPLTEKPTPRSAQQHQHGLGNAMDFEDGPPVIPADFQSWAFQHANDWALYGGHDDEEDHGWEDEHAYGYDDEEGYDETGENDFDYDDVD